jgi:hypothetical protein
MNNILKVWNSSKTCLRIYKSLFERQETILVNFPCFWIQIRIHNTDLEPGQPNECGSMRIRIHMFLVLQDPDPDPFIIMQK